MQIEIKLYIFLYKKETVSVEASPEDGASDKNLNGVESNVVNRAGKLSRYPVGRSKITCASHIYSETIHTIHTQGIPKK